MNDADTIQFVKLQVSKNEDCKNIHYIYNTPQNNPTLSLVHVSQQTVVVRNFNAHFQNVKVKV